MNNIIYKFYLKKDDNTYYYVGENGSVFETSGKTEIKSSIDSWKKAQVAFKRSPTYWAAFREYSTPLSFVDDAIKILLHILNQYDYTAKCSLLIEKFDPTNYSYAAWYEGDIEFPRSEVDSDFYDVNLKERGLVGIIKSREDKIFEIPLQASNAVNGKLDGVKLGARSRWVVGDSVKDDSDFPPLEHGFNNGISNRYEIFPTMSIGDDVQAGSFVIPRSASLRTYSSNSLNPPSMGMKTKDTSAKSTATWYNLIFSGLLEMDVKIDITMGTATTSKVKIGAAITDNNGNRVNTVVLAQSANINDNVWTNLSLPINGTLSQMDINSTITFYAEFARNGGAAGDQMDVRTYYYNDNSIITLNYQAAVNSTNYKAFRYIDLFKNLVSKMTDGQYTAASNFLSNTNTTSLFRKANYDNSPYNTLVTSGNGLRGLQDATIKTSLSDLFKDVFCRWGLCLAVENNNTVRLEPMSYFFDDTVKIMHVGTISKPTLKVWNEKLFNSVKVGYGNYDNSNVEGKNEVNTGITFLAKDNDQVSAELDLTTPYRADVYGIESVRAETIDEDDKDNRSDNDTFLVEGDPIPVGGYYLPYRPFGTITGVDDPTGIYNVALSPKRNLYRMMRYIRSFIKTGTLQFQTTDKNPELVSNIGTGTIVETADENLANTSFVGNSALPFFRPYLVEFDCAPPYNLDEILNAQTRGYISFTYNGTEFKGYIMDVGCTPATKESYRFSLLLHADSDLRKLF